MAIDQELERHQEMWINFTRLLKWSIAILVVVVAVVLRVVTH